MYNLKSSSLSKLKTIFRNFIFVAEFEPIVHETIHGLTVLRLPLKGTQKALAPSCKLGLLQIRGTNQFVLEVAPRICFVFLHDIFWKT